MPGLQSSLTRRRLTAYYATALMLIGCITLCSHLIQQRTLASSQGIASMINRSGRQRLLSQRIAGLAAEYRLGDPTAHRDLELSIDEMRAGHLALSQPYDGIPKQTSAARQLQKRYFQGDNSLDREVAHFLEVAQQLAALPAGDPRVPALLSVLNTEARAPLLNNLNDVVAIHQAAAEAKLRELVKLQWALLGIMAFTLLLEARLIFRPMVNKVALYSQQLLLLSTTDPLTGVANRRGFMHRCHAEFARVQRYGRPLSVISLDVDHFKAVNDRFGHSAGDAVLRQLATSIEQTLRPSDVVGRMGGEEFALLLPETTLADAAALAERLRTAVADLPIDLPGKPIRVTVSLGVSSVDQASDANDTALQAADLLMYQAKQRGRNCVVTQQAAPSSAWEYALTAPAVV